MNKRSNIICLLLLFLSGNFASNVQCSSFQSAQDQAKAYAINAAFAICGMYLKEKAIAKYEETTSPDAPPHFQQWAREILAKNGLKDADTIPLKMANRWAIRGNSIIQVNSREVKDVEDILAGRSTYSDDVQKILLVDAEYTLLHEKKHYDNNDGNKRVLLGGLVYPLLVPRQYTDWAIAETVVTSAIAAYATSQIIMLPYIRYQEKEADRYAFLHLSSLKKLEITKHIIEYNAQRFEKDLLTDSSSLQHTWLEKKMRPILADRWHTLDQGLAASSSEGQVVIRLKQKSLIEGASFLYDKEHPSFRTRAALAQECLDKRKVQCKKNFECAIGDVLRARGIKK